MDRSEADCDEARALLLAARKDWRALSGMGAVQFRYTAFAEMGEPVDRVNAIERVGTLMRQVEDLLK